MTNLNRLKLELANKKYFTDDEYTLLLEEQGLNPTSEYNKKQDELYLLQTVISILQMLSNDINLYRSIETEFATNTQAYTNLKDRIDELYKRIALIPTYEPTVSCITNLFVD